MNRYFNFKLYLEGIKKIRVTGIATAILVITLNVIVPIVEILLGETDTITAQDFAIPMLLILPLSPLFVISMFSYLNKRADADFYHSIPYSRACVYISFMASVLTWIWGIILASTLATTILWAAAPRLSLVTSVVWQIPLTYMLASLFIVSIMTVAMMLTGTLVTNLAIAAFMFLFVRTLGLLVTTCMESACWALELSYSTRVFWNINFFLPLSICEMLIGYITPSDFFSNYVLFIYTTVVSIALVVIGGFLYHFRKSEMAGQNAPSKPLHHLFHCLITLPFGMILTSYVICQVYSEESLSVVTLVLLTVMVLLVFYLYELITTKSWKKMCQSSVYLLCVALGCIIFAGGIVISRTVVMHDIPEKDEIECVQILPEKSKGYTYEDLITKNAVLDSEETKSIVADSISETMKYISQGQSEGDVASRLNSSVRVCITLTSGRNIIRTIRMTSSELGVLYDELYSSPSYVSNYEKLPSEKNIHSMMLSLAGENVYVADLSLWNVFFEEYTELSAEQKSAVKSYAGLSFQITVNGDYYGDSFTSTYYVTKDMPDTAAAFLDYASMTDLFNPITDFKVFLNSMDTMEYGQISLNVLYCDKDLYDTEFGYYLYFSFPADNSQAVSDCFMEICNNQELYHFDDSITAMVCFENYDDSSAYYVLLRIPKDTYIELNDLK